MPMYPPKTRVYYNTILFSCKGGSWDEDKAYPHGLPCGSVGVPFVMISFCFAFCPDGKDSPGWVRGRIPALPGWL